MGKGGSETPLGQCLTNPPDLSYFVSTLDHAQRVNSASPHGIDTLVRLLDERARTCPELPAVGMPAPASDLEGEWGCKVFSFADLSSISNELAHQLVLEGIVPAVSEEAVMEGPPCVAILSQSSLELLMNFLALTRVGYSVVLIAPQCTKHAISHLLKTTKSTHIFHSKSLTELATSSKSSSCVEHSLLEIPCPSVVKRYPTPDKIAGSTIAYIHHTSGTSTGLPKPIPQANAAATAYLPCLPPKSPTAAFTTTPLYHGGTADLMRSLMSSSMLWLYPPSVPVTSGNILKVLQVAERERLPIKLFTSVPYVLEMCVANREAMRKMVDMDMVGVGGAPLDVEVGATLVKEGVKLVSRFGSSECGCIKPKILFLMSSYRDFTADKNWDYLRISPSCTTLCFELQEGSCGRFELVVLPGWPQIAKPNRPDGSYATGDLFTLHPTAKNAYRYDGRNDVIVVLSNGKKFDPTHIEDAFKEYDLVREAIVFGNNRPFPGLLLFITAHRMLFGGIKEYVEGVNKRTHMKIIEEMIVIICADEEPPKNSKGTIMRGAVCEMFNKEIQQAYDSFERHEFGERMEITDLQAVKDIVHSIVREVTNKTMINDDTDLFTAGVDSVMTAQIRNQLTKNLKIRKPLPLNIVFEQRTIEGIVRFITTCGESNGDTTTQQEQLMLKLVQKYTNSLCDVVNQNPAKVASSRNKHVVILTGATGSLGAHVLSQLCHAREAVTKVVCLCRAKDHAQAHARIKKSLQIRKLPDLGKAGSRVVPLAAELGGNYLGLGKKIYDQLKEEATVVIHAAWAVNFVASLESFEKDHIVGTRNLIDLALGSQSRAQFYFCSSTAAVLGDVKPFTTIKERFTDDPHTAAPLGYSRSKWVTEKICQKLNGRAAVLRIGQLCGDTVNGVWNETEAWPLMFSSANAIGCLPELDEKLSWLPVDLAAQVILDIALNDNLHDLSGDLVFHIVNTDTSTSWGTVLDWIHELGDAKFGRVVPSTWVKRLADAENVGMANQSQKLLGLWEANYGKEANRGPETNCGPGDETNFNFETRNTVALSRALGENGGWKLHRKYMQNIWKHWVQSGFVKV